MESLKLVYAPNPIFQQIADPVTTFDAELASHAQQMLEIMYAHQGVGIGANMVGLLKRIIAIDLQEARAKNPLIFINPEIIQKSSQTQVFTEGSLSYPGASAKIERPKAITVIYQTLDGTQQQMNAEGWLSTVIQHEIDYLDGRVFLDYLSPSQRESQMKKVKKALRKLRK